MTKYIKIAFGIFIALSASRFIPHPPNFTSLIALSFYIPALLGRKYLPALLISFVLTDLVIGFHGTVFFTWGSLFLIAYLAKYFQKFYFRIFGVSLSCVIFFLV